MPSDETPPPFPDLPPSLPPRPPVAADRRWLVWLGGSLASTVAVGGLCILLLLLGRSSSLNHDTANKLIGIPSMFLVPLLNGLLAAFFWRRLEPTVGQVTLQSFFLLLMNLAGATVFLREGIICLIMVSPLLYGLVLGGACIGRVIFKSDPSLLRVSVLPVLAVLVLAEPFTRADRTGVVTDEILIHAPPAKVWPQITSFPPIPAAPRFWLFKIGLPYPMATTSAGDYVGADRRCIFSGDAVFKETVARIEPGRELTFDIVESPADPELVGHLTPQRGQFLLRDNGDGTTTLVGSTWYRLHVRPLWYFDWWTHLVFREVHLRVMEDVKRRAEG